MSGKIVLTVEEKIKNCNKDKEKIEKIEKDKEKNVSLHFDIINYSFLLIKFFLI